MSAINFPDPSQSPWTNESTGITYTYSNGVWKALSSEETFLKPADADLAYLKKNDGGTQQVISGGGGLNVDGDVQKKGNTVPSAVMGASAPSNPGICDFWTDTSGDDPVLKSWNGTEWVEVGSSTPSELAPVISNVTLTENDATGDRFTSQTFDVDVTMLVEGAPHSQKGLKGEVTAEFSVPNETSALTNYNNSVSTDVFNTPWSAPQESHNYYRKKWWVYVGDDCEDFRMVQVYLYSSNTIYVYGYNQPDDSPFLIKQISISTTGTPYLTAMHVEQKNGILYFHGSYENAFGNDQQFRMTLDVNNPSSNSFNCSRWDSRPGTYDGHIEWYFNSGNQLYARYNTNDTTNWSLAKSDSISVTTADTGLTFGGSWAVNSPGGWAHIPSHDQLVAFINRSNQIYTEVYQINRNALNDAGTSTQPNQNWVTKVYGFNSGLSTDGWKASWDLKEVGLFVNFWIGSTGKLAKYNPNTYGFDIVGDLPDDAKQNAGLGADRQGNLYLSGTDNGFSTFKVYRSTNGGASWQELTGWGNGTTYYSPFSNFADAGDWQAWGFYHTTSSSYSVFQPKRTLMSQTATVTSSSLGGFGDSEKIAKYGDENNSAYKGTLTIVNRSSGSIKLSTSGAWQNGDIVISRDGGTTQSSVKYLVLDNVGNVSSITSVDPGYVNVGPDTNQTLTFPATSPSGNAPDAELPAGTTFKVSAQATNSIGSSEYGPSNVITPA